MISVLYWFEVSCIELRSKSKCMTPALKSAKTADQKPVTGPIRNYLITCNNIMTLDTLTIIESKGQAYTI